MALTLTLAGLLTALGIFFLRICDMALDTIRLLFVVRGKRLLAWILGFMQSMIFVVAITSVLKNVNNILNIFGYAGGFATGVVLGMIIEERLAIGHIHFTIISSTRGRRLADQMRRAGYAVTEFSGRGKNGTVDLLHVDVTRKDMDHVETLVLETDPDAFVTYEDIRPVRRGFWRA